MLAVPADLDFSDSCTEAAAVALICVFFLSKLSFPWDRRRNPKHSGSAASGIEAIIAPFRREMRVSSASVQSREFERGERDVPRTDSHSKSTAVIERIATTSPRNLL